ncbi:MAG: hypothetical protein HQL26_02375 [Candidatus Omnitrophica bacterium]|nr:hypothetical protein [Candidatus Omnitrophota bacterium]
MKNLSLKLDKKILQKTDRMVKTIHISPRRALEKKLALESRATAQISLEILSEMEKIDYLSITD